MPIRTRICSVSGKSRYAGPGHAAGDGAFDRVHDRAELGQYPIAHDLEDPPAVALYFGLEHLGADGSDAREGAGFVALHMRRVAHHVCRQNYRSFRSIMNSMPQEKAGAYHRYATRLTYDDDVT